ncbi:MAG: sodium:proton antiporter [Lachnospiraceae bacterium]|nr:sodium:proton antiporter [Lachnospiraceae bacterium]
MMSGFLGNAVFLLLLIVVIGYFNEKVTKLTYEISLMLFSVIAGLVITVITAALKGSTMSGLLSQVQVFDLEGFLMEGVLCFMLFAGSCHMKVGDFKRLMRPVGVLAFVTTFLGAVFYGLLFYGISALLGLSFSLPMCLMFGSIIAPTDPIAATSILNRFGLPANVSFVIQGESLLNDGVGVALFVCFSGMVTMEKGGSFFQVLFQEILGAVVIGVLISVILFRLFAGTDDSKRRIFISLLSVSLSYFMCERLECSGAIASVVCGVMYATLTDRECANKDMSEFEEFWEIIDTVLNSVLYVMLGLSFVRILQMERVLLLSAMAVLCNLAARFASLYLSTFLMGKLPDGYSPVNFAKLLTWGGLRGGLSIALAMSTYSMLPDNTYHIVLGCTYAIVFFTTVVQGLSMKKVYERIS